MYVAYKNYASDVILPKRVIVILEVPYFSNGVWQKKNVFSDIDGKWETDGSSWVGDTGLTTKKLTIPFIVTDPDQPVTARVLFDWFDPTGYIYIDPLLEFA